MKSLVFIILFFNTLVYSQSENKSTTPFLEDIVSQFPNARDLALSPNLNEAVFSAQSIMGEVSALVSVTLKDGKWASEKVLPFSGRYFDIEPFFSKDGLTLYFASNRPLDHTSQTTKDFDIWYATRPKKNADWSEAKNMGAPINSQMDEFYPVITNSKNFYFTLDNKNLKRKDDIYVSTFENGVYNTPKVLSDAINSDGYEFNAYIAPDESFLIYTCYNRKEGLGSGDLYISYKQDNEEWSIAKNMGENINSNKMDYCPFVDIKTKTLYFTSKRNATKTTFDTTLDIEGLKKVLNSYDNGLSRLYKTSIIKFF
ncbi:hypothetical protein A9Q86_05260 [Flavobacteriales bacterium 33_180_T64]|nr:hypothetical protein A9Q86_05260 [Flavobacteriales bacterium 33_180_T64]